MNHKFDLDEWMSRIPWEVFADRDTYEASPVSGPLEICANEHLRRRLQDQYVWGRPQWMDIFIWGKGEPANRAATKFGGVPYRPKGKAWPVDPGGALLPFIAQFNFSDSQDLVNTPSNILLLFGIIYEGDFESIDGDYDAYYLEWQDLIDGPLIESSDIPDGLVWAAEPFYGHILRVANYPEAERIASGEYPMLDGKEVRSEHLLKCYQGTCIGNSHFIIQPYDREAPGSPLCALCHIEPSFFGYRFPWVNVETPEELEMGDVSWMSGPYPSPQLDMGDGGAVFIRRLDNGELLVHASYG
jgi:hypothetical protein